MIVGIAGSSGFIDAALPMLVRQRRPGPNRVPGTLVKFRSMTGRYDGHGHALPMRSGSPPSAGFLRFTSLDEVPTGNTGRAGMVSRRVALERMARV